MSTLRLSVKLYRVKDKRSKTRTEKETYKLFPVTVTDKRLTSGAPESSRSISKTVAFYRSISNTVKVTEKKIKRSVVFLLKWQI